MSEHEDVAARQLLETLAELNRLFRDHSVRLRRLPNVSAAQAFPLEAVYYRNGPRLEGYVEATLRNGDTLCWCLDVGWNPDHWIVEATLDRKSGDRQKTVGELPTATVTDFGKFLKELKRVTPELLALNLPETESA